MWGIGAFSGEGDAREKGKSDRGSDGGTKGARGNRGHQAPTCLVPRRTVSNEWSYVARFQVSALPRRGHPQRPSYRCQRVCVTAPGRAWPPTSPLPGALVQRQGQRTQTPVSRAARSLRLRRGGEHPRPPIWQREPRDGECPPEKLRRQAACRRVRIHPETGVLRRAHRRNDGIYHDAPSQAIGPAFWSRPASRTTRFPTSCRASIVHLPRRSSSAAVARGPSSGPRAEPWGRTQFHYSVRPVSGCPLDVPPGGMITIHPQAIRRWPHPRPTRLHQPPPG